MSKKYPALTKAKLKVVPFGQPNCPICRLKPKELIRLHELRFVKNYTIKQIRDYLKYYHKISPENKKMMVHFDEHISSASAAKIQKIEETIPEVMNALQKMPVDTKVATNKEIESAYTKLTNMASGFTDKVADLVSRIDIKDKDIKERIESMGPIKALEVIGKLHKESREMVSSIIALRAPRVLVSQFLEASIDDVIESTGSVLTQTCLDIQRLVLDELKRTGVDHNLTGASFSAIFKETGVGFMDKMVALRREQVTKANIALADMERVI